MIARSLAIILALGSTPAWADGIIDNVNGITLDKEGKIIRFTALLVDDAGKVSKLITAKDKAPKRPDWRSDGKGLTMIPGLIDANVDIMALGFQALTLDLSQTKTLAEAKLQVAEYVAKFPNRRWVLGRGWDQAKWNMDRLPSAGDLSSVAAGKPVWLLNSDGSAGWANDSAMQIAGITSKTKIGVSGKIIKQAGKPSGIFVGAAKHLIEKHIPPPRAKDRDIALARAQKQLLSSGITAVTDMGTTIDKWQSYRRAGDNRRLNMRIFGYADGPAQMEKIAGPAPTPWLYGERLRLGGVRLKIDGSLSSRGAWLKQPYDDAPGDQGIRYDSYAELRNSMVRAAMDGFQVSLHASGDAAVAEAIGAVADLAETFPDDRRWRIENAHVIDAADLPKLGANDIMVSVQPANGQSSAALANARLGVLRADTAFPAASILAAGAPLSLGSNIPAGKAAPFADMAGAITREDENGQPFGGWRAEERLTRVQALAAYTINPARAAFAEDKVGSLTPGHNADFLLIDTDPLLASTSALRKTKVMETWVAGRAVYKSEEAAVADSQRFNRR